jgi:hypothetical protein
MNTFDTTIRFEHRLAQDYTVQGAYDIFTLPAGTVLKTDRTGAKLVEYHRGNNFEGYTIPGEYVNLVKITRIVEEIEEIL